MSNLETVNMSNLETVNMSNLETVNMSNLETVNMANLETDSYWSIAYRYLEMVTLQTSTLPCTWRTTRFPVFCTTTGK